MFYGLSSYKVADVKGDKIIIVIIIIIMLISFVLLIIIIVIIAVCAERGVSHH